MIVAGCPAFAAANGAAPQISPESPIGEVYRYRVVGPPGYSVMDLKTLQDWVPEQRFKAVPGVIDVTGWGGKTKIYEVTVNLGKLIEYGLTLPRGLQVLNNSNINVGGQTVLAGGAVRPDFLRPGPPAAERRRLLDWNRQGGRREESGGR